MRINRNTHAHTHTLSLSYTFKSTNTLLMKQVPLYKGLAHTPLNSDAWMRSLRKLGQISTAHTDGQLDWPNTRWGDKKFDFEDGKNMMRKLAQTPMGHFWAESEKPCEKAEYQEIQPRIYFLYRLFFAYCYHLNTRIYSTHGCCNDFTK